MSTHEHFDAVSLFSGGLDSILAARLIRDQGLKVLGLHFVSPFFGKPELIPHWEEIYNIPLRAVDIGAKFANMLKIRPEHGFGKVLNPCVDCKIAMLREADLIMREVGARIIVSGEVLGQRPMSQRRDTLHLIQREAGVRGHLLRPLSALRLESTRAEDEGIIDRARLLEIHGRGRKEQLALAEAMGLKEIPTPAGGCLLAERENARSYWPVLLYQTDPGADDFHLANTGRQYWNRERSPLWLCTGRNQADNDRLLALANPADLLFKVKDFPGPIALGRQFASAPWDEGEKLSAASFMASFSPKASRHAWESGEKIPIRIHSGSGGLDSPGELLLVAPERSAAWLEFSWEEAKEGIRAERRPQNPSPK